MQNRRNFLWSLLGLAAAGRRLAASPFELPSGPPRIVLDPGHGGKDWGTQNARLGVKEKDLVLQIARRLKSAIDSGHRARAILTRDDDYFVALDDRAGIANREQGVLFLSVHANFSIYTSVKGFETYFLSSNASDEKAFELAALENAAAEADGGLPSSTDPLAFLLLDMAQNEFHHESFRVAEQIQERVHRALGTRNRGVRQAPFNVLKGIQMPGVLIESGFLSNADEAQKLTTEAYQQKVVAGLAEAVDEFTTAYLARVAPRSGGGSPSSR